MLPYAVQVTEVKWTKMQLIRYIRESFSKYVTKQYTYVNVQNMKNLKYRFCI